MPTDKPTTYRPAHFVGHGADGQTLRYTSTLTPESDTCRTLIVCRPATVVPIVFVPGIMGSNLKAKSEIRDRSREVVVNAGDPVWRVDGVGSMLPWLTKSADEYQLRLRHGVAEVDDQGALPASGLQCQSVYKSTLGPAPLSVQQLRQRGWGEVSALFYLPFLDWLEFQLNFAGKDFGREGFPDNPVLTSLKQVHTGTHPLGGVGQPDSVPPLSAQDIDRLLSCDNPVHAFGYNWLQSNAASGAALKARIESIIQGYRDQGKRCEQVILVTHSMGGLVARAACKIAGAEALVAGVFHGVMPTDGAAATYKRMVSGFGGEGGSLLDNLKGWPSAQILGPSGQFTTPTLALNPGPLELLPNRRYNNGQPWFFVEDASGQKLALPRRGDPYSEIYTESKHWWKPCNEAWMNPAGVGAKNSFDQYLTALGDAKYFHEDLHKAGDFHPVTHAHYGQDPKHKAYATVRWMLDQTLSAEQQTSLQRHNPQQADTQLLLTTGQGTSLRRVFAAISPPDAEGDGTVPAQASARRVGQAAGMCVAGTGYAHDASYAIHGGSEGPRAALHAVLHILKTRAAA